MNKSFTLIEILVVIVVIGVLSAFILVGMSSVTSSANIAKGKAFANSLRNSLLINLISEWKFDGTGVVDGQAATTAYTQDSWGTNNGSLVSGNEPDVKSGNNCVSGSCLQFTKANSDYISCGNILSKTSGTLMAWIKPSGTYGSAQYIMAGFSSGGSTVTARYVMGAIDTTLCSSSWYIVIANGTTAQIPCSGEVYNSTNYPADKWVLLAATYDGTNVKFYKNGNIINTVSQTVSAAGDAQPYVIGRCGGYNGYYYSGIIDEVRIFDEAVSASRIEQNYYSGLNKLLIYGSIDNKEYNKRINICSIN